ncbi:helix-turn-helix domain-containing protein, partial [Kallipyga massiliensis]|uniref:helix-turn-helix domain-containing protein n=1 Tax=Kallipyga massiliensis TaxID=1472764 RepID=UPI0026F0CAFD
KETTKETTKEKNSIQEQIVLLMKENSGITAEQIANEIKEITADGVRYHIKILKAHGVIRREGSTKSGKWIVIK